MLKGFGIAILAGVLFYLGYLVGVENSQVQVVEKVNFVKSDLPEEKVIYKEKKVFVESDNSQEELKKAQELYSKAFNLFLANLGLRLKGKEALQLENVISDPETYIQENPEPESLAKVEVQDSSLYMSPIDFFKVIKKEYKDEAIYPELDLLKVAQSNILKDPAIYYAKSNLVKDLKTIKKYNGFYKGSLYILLGENKARVDDISLKISFQNEKEGTFELVMSENGNVYSDSRGRGGNNDIRMNGDHLVLDVGPDTFIEFPAREIETGNLYRQGKYLGVVKLQKI